VSGCRLIYNGAAEVRDDREIRRPTLGAIMSTNEVFLCESCPSTFLERRRLTSVNVFSLIGWLIQGQTTPKKSMSNISVASRAPSSSGLALTSRDTSGPSIVSVNQRFAVKSAIVTLRRREKTTFPSTYATNIGYRMQFHRYQAAWPSEDKNPTKRLKETYLIPLSPLTYR
jgi:hypothetical protein